VQNVPNLLTRDYAATMGLLSQKMVLGTSLSPSLAPKRFLFFGQIIVAPRIAQVSLKIYLYLQILNIPTPWFVDSGWGTQTNPG